MATGNLSAIARYGFAIVTVAAALGLSVAFRDVLGSIPGMIFFMAVVATAWVARVGPALLAAALSSVALDYYLVDTFVGDPEGFIRIGVFFIVAASVASLGNVRRLAVQRAQRSGELLAVTLASIGDGVLATDSAGKVTFINGVAERLTGWTWNDAIGQPLDSVFRIIDEDSREALKSPFDAVMSTGEIVGLANHTLLVARDNSECPIEDSGAPIRDEDGATIGAVLVFRDGSERRRVESNREQLLEAERVARSEAELAQQRFEYLAIASSVLASSLDYESTLTSIVRMVVPRLADWATVDMLIDGDIKRLAVAHVDPDKVEWAWELYRKYPRPIDAASGVPAVLRTGKSEFNPHLTWDVIEKYTDDPELLGILREIGFTSSMTVPICLRDRVAGAITFVTAESGRQFDDSDLALAEDVARRASSAIEHAELYREIARQRSALEITLASIGDGVISTDDRGRIAFINPVAEQLTGWSASEAVGLDVANVFDVTSELSGDRVENPVARVLREGDVVEKSNGTVLRDRSGVSRPIDDSAAPIRNDDGAISGVVMTFRDASERRRSEADLRLSESRFRLMVEQSPLSIQIFSPDGLCVQANSAWEELWQTPAEALKGYNILDDPQLAANGVIDVVRRAFAGEAATTPPTKYDPADIGRTGRSRWVRAVIYPVVDDTTTIREVVLVLEDVTERVVAEQRLQIQVAVSHLLAEANTIDEAAAGVLEAVGEQLDFSYGGMWLVDSEREVLRIADSWTRKDLTASATVAASRALEFSPGEGLPGLVWLDRVPVFIRDVASEQSLKRMSAFVEDKLCSAYGVPVLLGNDVYGVFEFFSRNEIEGREVLVDTMTAIGSQIAQFMERRRAEDRLRESEERYRAVAETASDVIFVVDQGSTILFANQAVESVFGYHSDELIGTSLTQIMPDHLRLVHERAMSRYVNTGVRHIDWGGVELPGLHRDGHTVPVEISFGEFTKDGRHFFTGIVRDITDRKTAERELKLAIDQAQAANAAKDQFLAVLSHELRTPLTPVLTLVQFLETVDELPEDIGSMFTMIRRNIELEARLIDDLLDLTRISRGKLHLDLELVDTHGLMLNVIDICREDISAKQLHLTTAFDARDHTVNGDPARLQQVFWNLLQNAVKFTPEGGRVMVRSRNATSGAIEIEVEDDGIGLEQEQMGRVFNAFEQGEQSISRRFGGLGLGLSISRSIVDMHGGTIEAISDGLNSGSTFVVRLATADHSEESSAESAPVDESVPDESPRRILLVDDHADTSSVMKLLLERKGFTVETAADVAGALALAESREYDLLISDIGLPDGTGLELMQRIREKKPLPGIALSGFGMEDDISRSHEAGFSEHLIKPVNFQALQEAIRRVMS